MNERIISTGVMHPSRLKCLAFSEKALAVLASNPREKSSVSLPRFMSHRETSRGVYPHGANVQRERERERKREKANALTWSGIFSVLLCKERAKKKLYSFEENAMSALQPSCIAENSKVPFCRKRKSRYVTAASKCRFPHADYRTANVSTTSGALCISSACCYFSAHVVVGKKSISGCV